MARARGSRISIGRAGRRLALVLLLAAGLFGSWLPQANLARAATCFVKNGNDDGDGSLRASLASTICDTITFDLPMPQPWTITLTSGTLSIERNVTIVGPGADNLTVRRSAADGTPQFGIFNIQLCTVAISGMTIAGGQDTSAGGGIYTRVSDVTLSDVVIRDNSARSGGGIYIWNDAKLAVVDSTIRDNSATDHGGGISADSGSRLTFTGSAIQDNTATQNGGIEASDAGTVVEFTDSAVSGNQVTNSGGGIGIFDGAHLTFSGGAIQDNTADWIAGGLFALGSGTVVTLTDATIVNNSAGKGSTEGGGGGVRIGGGATATLTGLTVRDNVADWGGGVQVAAAGTTVALANSTLTGNSATYEGSGLIVQEGATTTVTNVTVAQNIAPTAAQISVVTESTATVRNTIIAGDSTLCLDITDGGNNLQYDYKNPASTVCGATIPVGDPLLGTLQENGGPTKTLLPGAGSPAIDGGDNALCAAAPVGGVDQRGVARPQGARCDIGAVEVGPPNAAPTLTGLTSTPTPVVAGAGGTITLTLTGSGFVQGFSTVRIDGLAAVNGGPIATTYVSPTQLTATLPAFPLGAHGDYVVTVVTSAPGGGTSASRTLTVVRPTTTVTAIVRNDPSPTNAPSVSWTVTFGAAVSGLSATNLALTPTDTATGTIASVTPNGTVPATTWTVGADGIGGTGTLRLDLANDTNLLPYAVAPYTSGTPYTIDATAPDAPVVVTPANGAITNNPQPSIGGTAEANSTVTVFIDDTDTGMTGADATGDWSLTPLAPLAAGAHTVWARASDTLGNTSVDSNTNSFTIDTVAPTVTIATTAPDPTNAAAIAVTVTFSKPVTGFDASDLAAQHAMVANFAGAGATYTFDLVFAGQGAATVTIAAGVATDSAGNGNTVAAPLTRTYDPIAPAVTIEQAAGQADPTATGPIRFTVRFSEPISGFAAADVTLAGTAGATTATVTGSGTTYEVAVGGMANPGTVVATVRVGAATDAAGNVSAASTSVDNTVMYTGQGALTVIVDGPGTVNPGSGSYPRGPLTLTATPKTGAIFTGWDLDGTFVGWLPTLTVNLADARSVTATFVSRPAFTDVAPGGVAWDAITQLAARGIIKGYGDGQFGPGDTVLRAQLAALIVRAFDWDTARPNGPAPFSDLGGVDPELQRAIAILAQRGIINGYGDGTFGPTDPVKQAQVISFIARSMVQAGYWTPVTQDDPRLYPDVSLSSGHRLDLLTFVKYAGALPDRPQGQGWADWQAPASRGWTAQVLWQALGSEFAIDRVP